MSAHNFNSAKALIDSGFKGNFISRDFNRFHIPQIPCQKMSVHSILGKPLGQGVITHCTPSLTLHIGVTHYDLLLDGSTADIILGYPWLKHHNPHISWTSDDILS